MAVLKRIGPASAFKIGLVSYAFLGLIAGVFWSLIALTVQIIVYFLVKIPVPNLSGRIAAGELAPAIWLGLASLAAGALNAACMIY